MQDTPSHPVRGVLSRMFVLSSLGALLTLTLACKTRDPNAGGLLDDDETTPTLGLIDPPASGNGQWTVTCVEQDGGAEDGPAASYRFAVLGAVDERDETQAISVSVEKLGGAAGGARARTLADSEPGRGALSIGGPLFLGFASGVLTAEPSGDGRHIGVTTLQRDDEAQALSVTCVVVKG